MNIVTGSSTALITPFKNGKLDEQTYAALIKRQIDNGMDAVCPVGTTGESATLTHWEDKRCIEIAVEVCKGTHTKVLAGAGSNSTAEAINIAKHAQSFGVDAIFSVSPYYNKPSQEGLYQHYKAIAESVPDLPFMLYNVPGRTGVDISADTTIRLFDDIPNIYGVKEATGSLERTVELLSRRPELKVFSGDDAIDYPILANGGAGIIDLDTLIPVLKNINQQTGPRLLHIRTQKGKGYFPAEDAPVKYHATSAFDLSTGKAITAAAATATDASKPPSYTEIFGQWLCDMATQDERLVGITPAMREGSGLVEFSKKFPQRYFDVGIAEQHAVTLAAGMACDGLKPVVAIYSTFLQRAYDQLIHDVAIQNLSVVFAIDRAGIVGADGPTHTGAYDISFLRCIPNMVIMTPADKAECRGLLTTAFLHDGPSAVRYPRGCVHELSMAVNTNETGKNKSANDKSINNKLQALPFAQAKQYRHGNKIAILVFGTLLATAIEVAEELGASVYSMRFVKPLDTNTIKTAAEQHDLLVTIEDNAIAGGAGSAISEYLIAQNLSTSLLQIGFPDEFINHGNPDELFSDWKLDKTGILQTIQDRINSNVSP